MHTFQILACLTLTAAAVLAAYQRAAVLALIAAGLALALVPVVFQLQP